VFHRRGAVCVGVALCAVLAGCTPPRPDIPGPTANAIERFTERQLVSMWGTITVPYDLRRPKIEPVRMIRDDEYGRVMDDCLRGFSTHDYRNLYGYRLIAQEPEGIRDEILEGVAWYVCMAQYPVDPSGSGLLSKRQLDYLYDYYRRWVVPCLILNGYDPGPVPLRKTFVSNGLAGNFWSPTDELWGEFGFTDAEFSLVEAKCSPYPQYLYPDL